MPFARPTSTPKEREANAPPRWCSRSAPKRLPATQAVSRAGQRYGEEAFRAELPEAVCGESDRTRVKIENVKQVLEEARVAYTADVLCSEVKFLGSG